MNHNLLTVGTLYHVSGLIHLQDLQLLTVDDDLLAFRLLHRCFVLPNPIQTKKPKRSDIYPGTTFVMDGPPVRRASWELARGLAAVETYIGLNQS